MEGEIDMDSLSTRLRGRAKCAETGVVVSEADVKEIFAEFGLHDTFD